MIFMSFGAKFKLGLGSRIVWLRDCIKTCTVSVASGSAAGGFCYCLCLCCLVLLLQLLLIQWRLHQELPSAAANSVELCCVAWRRLQVSLDGMYT